MDSTKTTDTEGLQGGTAGAARLTPSCAYKQSDSSAAPTKWVRCEMTTIHAPLSLVALIFDFSDVSITESPCQRFAQLCARAPLAPSPVHSDYPLKASDSR